MLKKLLLLAAITCSYFFDFAQSGTVSSGGQAAGSGGNVSYSVGQINFISESGSNGSVNQGVQQPYEILVVSGINKLNVTLSASVYPNPSEGIVTLKLDGEIAKNVCYDLFDESGKFIRKKDIVAKETPIPLNDLAEGVYYIKVLQDKAELKTFKIIKNK